MGKPSEPVDVRGTTMIRSYRTAPDGHEMCCYPDESFGQEVADRVADHVVRTYAAGVMPEAGLGKVLAGDE